MFTGVSAFQTTTIHFKDIYKDGEECLEKVLKRSVIFSWGMFLNDCFTYIIIKYEEEHEEKTKFIARGMVSGEGLLTYMMT